MRSWWRGRRLRSAIEPAPRPIDDADAFAQVLLDEGREELDRADAKASILLAGSGVFAAAVLAGSVSGDWDPSQVADWRARLVVWTALGAGVTGIIALAAAVVPRTRHLGRKEDLAYFGHVVLFRDGGFALRRMTRRARLSKAKAELADAVRSASRSRLDRTIDQVWTVSMIVNKKYRYIRFALLSFGAAAIAAGIGIALDARW